MNRIEREKKIIGRMIAIYCRAHHDVGGVDHCPECKDLLDYALERIERCPKGSSKSSCRKCEIHCYASARREAIRNVMRYVGPRMIFIHPLDAVVHLWRELLS